MNFQNNFIPAAAAGGRRYFLEKSDPQTQSGATVSQ